MRVYHGWIDTNYGLDSFVYCCETDVIKYLGQKISDSLKTEGAPPNPTEAYNWFLNHDTDYTDTISFAWEYVELSSGKPDKVNYHCPGCDSTKIYGQSDTIWVLREQDWILVDVGNVYPLGCASCNIELSHEDLIPRPILTPTGDLRGTRVTNHYACECGAAWSENWSCGCDDRCPACDTSNSPHFTDDNGVNENLN